MISSLYLTSSCSCMTTGIHHSRHNHHRDPSPSPSQRKTPEQFASDSNNEIDANGLWRSKVVPTFHKSDNLETSSKSDYLYKSKNILDYQSDDPNFDSQDYESEDPRAHQLETEHQLEKSLLDKEHTSRRPEVKCDNDNNQKMEEVPSADSPESGIFKNYHHHFINPVEKLVPPTPHISHCPTCYAHYLNHEKTFVDSNENRNKIDGESIRLEAIKQQILNKLGLKHRPIIRKKLPREIVLQSLYRAEEDNFDFSVNDDNSKLNKNKIFSNTIRTNSKNQFETNQLNSDQDITSSSGEPFLNAAGPSSTPTHTSTSYSTNEVQDDFYARTSEIIVFGDAGKLHNFYYTYITFSYILRMILNFIYIDTYIYILLIIKLYYAGGNTYTKKS